MVNIIKKEARLSSLVIVYVFVVFGGMFMLPGYPVLCGAFFVTLGLYQNFRYGRECNDILFSVLLPVARQDVVKGKFIFSCMIEISCFILMAAATLVRMTVLSDAEVYRSNALMNANCFALGMALLLFGVFNLMFIGAFFKTGYRTGKPFVLYMIACFVIIGIGEAMHHLPGMGALNAFGFENLLLQIVTLAAGMLCFAGLTAYAYRKSCSSFEMIDL